MLTELQLRKLDASAGLVSAGGVPGLYFKASAPGRGKWVLRFVSPVTGSRRDMGLGTYPEIGLASARQRALRERDAIAEGKDPLEQKREAERAAASARQEFTFDEAARQVHDGMKAGFRNEKHSAQWLTSLEAYIFPKIGHRKISELRASDFADGLRPIWLAKPRPPLGSSSGALV